MGRGTGVVECLCGCGVVEGGFGAVVQFLGGDVDVGLVAGDGGSSGGCGG